MQYAGLTCWDVIRFLGDGSYTLEERLLQYIRAGRGEILEFGASVGEDHYLLDLEGTIFIDEVFHLTIGHVSEHVPILYQDRLRP